MRTALASAITGISLLILTSCTLRGPSPRYADPAPYLEAVEVSNRASFSVMVKYYTQGGGPHPLGLVESFDKGVFRLPRRDAGYILVETEDGVRIPRRSNLVEIRRFRVDPLTGEEIRG